MRPLSRTDISFHVRVSNEQLLGRLSSCNWRGARIPRPWLGHDPHNLSRETSTCTHEDRARVWFFLYTRNGLHHDGRLLVESDFAPHLSSHRSVGSVTGVSRAAALQEDEITK